MDGGQHLRSPGEEPLQITKKNIEQIFKDPIFNHKEQIFKLENKYRRQAVNTVCNSIYDLEKKLYSPQNFKQFFWTPDFNCYGFGTINEIKQTTDAINT